MLATRNVIMAMSFLKICMFLAVSAQLECTTEALKCFRCAHKPPPLPENAQKTPQFEPFFDAECGDGAELNTTSLQERVQKLVYKTQRDPVTGALKTQSIALRNVPFVETCVQGQMCGKKVLTRGSKVVKIERGCYEVAADLDDCDLNLPDGQCQVIDLKNGKLTTCTCSENMCNAATKRTITAPLIIVVVAIVSCFATALFY